MIYQCISSQSMGEFSKYFQFFQKNRFFFFYFTSDVLLFTSTETPNTRSIIIALLERATFQRQNIIFLLFHSCHDIRKMLPMSSIFHWFEHGLSYTSMSPLIMYYTLPNYMHICCLVSANILKVSMNFSGWNFFFQHDRIAYVCFICTFMP